MAKTVRKASLAEALDTMTQRLRESYEENQKLRDVLEYLDNMGGLGYEKDGRIRDVLKRPVAPPASPTVCAWCAQGDHSHHSDGGLCGKDNRFNADCHCTASPTEGRADSTAWA